MPTTFLEAIRRYSDIELKNDGVLYTSVPGLTVACFRRCGHLHHSVTQPLVCFLAQGGKQVTVRGQSYQFVASETLFVTTDAPMISEITDASKEKPYLALAVNLDLSIIAELAEDMPNLATDDMPFIEVLATEKNTLEAADRLLRLHDNPQSISALSGPRMKELHYWLMLGKHGPAMQRLGIANSSARRVAPAIKKLRNDFAQAISIEELAMLSAMSISSFHQHFRVVTSITPLQFQKQLRLIEAKRLMTLEGQQAGEAAFSVGYESISQFTREYGRMFGASPSRDTAHS